MEASYEKKIHGRPEFPFTVYPCSIEVNKIGTPLHWHEEVEILYIVSGSACVNVQGERIFVNSGDVVLVASQKVHGIDQDPNNKMTHYALLFRPSMLGSEYVDQLQGNCRILPCYLPKGSSLNEKLTPLLLDLSMNRKRVNSEYSLMILSHLYAIVYHILHSNPKISGSDVEAHANYDRLKVILEYLRHNFEKEITVAEAAQMCGFSSSHFMKLFRELTGSSFAQYVKNYRLEMAARKLRTTGSRVGEIAEEVGFHNLSYFTRAFEAKYHMTPGSYRLER